MPLAIKILIHLLRQMVIPPSWLFGHLADTDDKLFELFGIQKRMSPELEKIYHHERGTNQIGHLSKAELTSKMESHYPPNLIRSLNHGLKRIG